MLISEFFSKRLLPVISLLKFNFALVFILILLLIYIGLSLPNKSLFNKLSLNKLSPNKLLPIPSSTKSSKYFNIDFQYANFYCRAGINMGISKSLSFCERKTNSGEIDFFCSIFTRLVVFITATFNDLFDVDVIETLVVAGLIILHFNIEY